MVNKKSVYFRCLVTAMLLWLPVFVASTWAQASGGCDAVTLEEANRVYRIGKFQEVLQMLSPCLEKGFSDKEKVEGYRLQALTFLALDEFEQATASVEELLKYDPLYDPSIYDPPTFVRMVTDIKSGRIATQITSVSKKAEDPLEAPATVTVITEDQIRDRGYADLIDLLQDLPGFDVSKIYGVTYANIYQRGFRQNNTERTLFLIDGVEENDLWTNTAFISRQYPLSNIKRVEVVYGPASTMYGPNAFSGVINVITKDAADITGEDKGIGISGQGMYGSWNTAAMDMTIAGRKENISFTLTGRYFSSDEMDLSGESLFNYDPADYDQIDYISRLSVNADAAQFVRANALADGNPLYSIERNGTGDTVGINLTAAGNEAARNLDKAGYEQEIGDEKIQFSNHTKDWLINGKVKVGNFTAGFQTWRREEGASPSFNDMDEAGSRNGSVWIPKLSFYYLKYEKQLGENLFISNFTRYKTHEVDEASTAVYVLNYENGFYSLGDLVAGAQPLWVEQYYYQLSKQLRSETKVIYTPNTRFDLVSGVEIRNSQLQGNYLNTFFTGNPQDSGVFDGPQEGGNQFDIRDIGVFAQAGYKVRPNLRVILGARVDDNRIRSNDGFKTELSPRLAAVYTPGKFILKGIYARGIQNVSNWTKYSTSDIRNANGDLGTENIQNIELSVGWKVNKPFFVDLAVYNSSISDVVGTVPDVNDPGKEINENIGTFSIFGAQANAYYKLPGFTAYLNYTFTDPQDEDNNLRIGDIASHRINLGATKMFFDKLSVNLRANLIGDRATGEGTTVAANPDDDIITGYMLLNSAIGYKGLVPGLTLQLVANNLLDEVYYHPGPRSASGTFYTSRVLQRERYFLLRVYYDF